MDKLLKFGRAAMLYIKIFSGYEERRIRNHRLQLEKRILQAEGKSASLRKIPEQIILAQLRHMVKEMQALNRKLDEAEVAIEEYLKPIDKQAESVIQMQLDREEKQMEVIKAVQAEASLLAEEAVKDETIR